MTTLPATHDLRSYLGVQHTGDDQALDEALAAALSRVRAWCGRSFAPADVVASVREYEASGDGCVWIDDAVEVVGPVAGSRYPLSGIGPDGMPGWPISLLKGVWRPGEVVAVEARWGWGASIPDDVRTAILSTAKDIAADPQVRFGAAGMGEFGAIRARLSGLAETWLVPYRHARSAAF